jgi:hydrogenase/urease accessory protein HupE
MKLRRCVFAGLLLVAWGVAWAHDPGLSTAQGQITATAIEIAVGFSPVDAQQLLPLAARTAGKWTAAEFATARKPLEELARELWDVRASGVVLVPREVHADLVAGDNLSFRVVFPRPATGRVVFRARQLGKLPPGHREFVTFEDRLGVLLARKLLSAKSDRIEFELPGDDTGGVDAENARETPPTFWAFLKLGVEHIWTGYDHLLFLFALLVVCRRFRSIITIVSCFTLAHSITLAVATLGWLNVSSRLIEPAIAASIVFVGVENLARRGAEPRGRWALTFVFGLIHGFGFASVLRELGVGQGGQGLAMPLLSFNLGVEVGQITIVAVVLPVVWRLRKNDRFVERGVPILSAIVAAAGCWWFLQRTVFS